MAFCIASTQFYQKSSKFIFTIFVIRSVAAHENTRFFASLCDTPYYTNINFPKRRKEKTTGKEERKCGGVKEDDVCFANFLLFFVAAIELSVMLWGRGRGGESGWAWNVEEMEKVEYTHIERPASSISAYNKKKKHCAHIFYVSFILFLTLSHSLPISLFFFSPSRAVEIFVYVSFVFAFILIFGDFPTVWISFRK